MPKVKVDGWRCVRCSHEWCLKNTGNRIIICPKCQTKEVKD